jgi:deazaflavin-dependent oxidoreductase (nitroreductase family)
VSDFNDKVISEFHANNGNVSTAGFGRNLVLLHTVGAKSGEPRIHPLMSIAQPDGSWLVMASKGGAPTHPAWYFNLVAHPEASVEVVKDDTIITVPVDVSEVPTADYEQAFEQFTRRSPAFAQYRERSEGRVMPIMKLAPRTAS